MTIHDLIRICKSRLERRDVYLSILVILVGLSAFGLGRLSVLDEQRESVQIEYATSTAAVGALPSDSSGNAPIGDTQSEQVFGSRTGMKYYFPWCSNNISDKNKVWFKNKEEAVEKGYTPATNCKGL